jgi:catechol 2,3-dioxygenase-like lactoylglutathione lyase family enzyme
MDGSPPTLEAVLETALYYRSSQHEQMTRFYTEVLGLRSVAGWNDGTAYRVGPGVLLLFDLEKLAQREEPISAHGAVGPGHACLVVSGDRYQEWKDRIAAETTIDDEITWDSGFRSFYFRDPAGNLLEIADGDLWPR